MTDLLRYTYCVTFSALIISAADLTNYWHTQQIFKALIYVLGPIVLMLINAFPVEVFGWIEFFGGILKLALVLGTIVLMFAINGGVGGTKIGTEYFVEGVTFNSKVASASYQAVFEAIPIATFAYIGIELVTTTAFEALDPDELRLPAANVGWFSTVLYTLATGSFVANVSWQDQNLPKLFQQALTIITDADAATKFQEFFAPEPETHASPLIALLRTGFVFLPSFLNGCFMYSALSCANTALYVASRQLYGMTRTITVDSDSGFIRRGFHWMSSVHYRTKAPWPAIAISGLLLCWLPFLRIHDDDDEFLKDVSLGPTCEVVGLLIHCRSKTFSSTSVPSLASSFGAHNASPSSPSFIGARSTKQALNDSTQSGRNFSRRKMEATFRSSNLSLRTWAHSHAF